MNPSTHRTTADGSPAAARRATVGLASSMLLASLGTSIANIALPALAEGFAAPFTQVQGVVVAYLAGLTVSVFIAGRLGDRHGLKPMLLAGLALFAGGALLCALAPGLWLLTAARALQGAGAAFMMTLSMALMRDTADPARIGRAMGLLGTVSALGTALGPSLGGMLVSASGWRAVFVAQVPLALVAAWLVVTWLPRPQQCSDRPAPPSGAMPARALAIPLVVNATVAAVMMATLIIGPFFLGAGLGLNETQAGLVMSAGPVISIFAGVPAGRRVDVWGSQRVLALGLGLLAGGALLLSWLPVPLGVAGYLLAIAVLTPGYQLFQAANNTATLADVPPQRRGAASGLLALSRNLGLMAGASAAGAVFAFGVGTGDFVHADPPALANGLRITFALAGALMVGAIALSFADIARRRPDVR